MNASTGNGGDFSDHARQVAQHVGDRLNDQVSVLRDSATTVRYHSEDFIQNNPWPALALAAGCGFLLGVMIARR
jgi:ElaB/YqjD/DUF883 family membrane-anchored ribosome-binding protein